MDNIIEIIKLINDFNFNIKSREYIENKEKRDDILSLFNNISNDFKKDNPELTNKIFSNLSLPYSEEVVSIEQRIAKKHYSYNGS